MANRFSVETIFKAVDHITRPIKRMQSAMKRFTKSAAAGFKRLSRRLSSLSSGILGFGKKVGLVGLGVAASFGFMLKKFANAGDALGKLSSLTGFSVEALQEWRQAAELAGVDGESFNKSIGGFAKRLGELKAGTGSLFTILNKLDPAFADQLKNVENTEQAFGMYIDKLRDIKDDSIRTALATAGFGRSAGNMAILAQNSAEAIEAMREQARRSGLISEKSARQAELFNDALTLLKDAALGVRNVIGDALLPILTPLILKFKELLIGLRPQIAAFAKEFAKDLPDTLESLISKTNAWFSSVSDVAKSVNNFIDKIRAFSDILIGLGGLMIQIVLVNTAFQAIMIASTIAMAAYKVGVVAFNGVMFIFNNVMKLARLAMLGLTIAMWANPIGVIIAAFVALIAVGALLIMNWGKIKIFFVELWDSMSTGISNFIDKFKVLKLALLPFMTMMRGLKKLGVAFGITTEDSTEKEEARSEKARSNRQIITPDQRVAHNIEESISKEQAEIIIRDETGKAEVTKGFSKGGNISFNLFETGAFSS